jgi:hypothetical protein
MYFWIIVGSGIVIFVIYKIVHAHRKQARKQARYDAWCEAERQKWLKSFNEAKARSGLDTLNVWLGKPDNNWTNAEVIAALQEIAEAVRQATAARQAAANAAATEFYDSLRTLTDIRERWLLLKKAPDVTSQINDGEVTLKSYKLQALGPYVELLLNEAREGGLKSFKSLSSLVYPDGVYSTVIGTRYVYPTDWDEMLVGFCKEPMVEQFRNQIDYSPSQILLIAAEAARTKSFVRAKLVLAYCAICEEHDSGNGSNWHSQLYWPYRDAVGEILLTELATFVDHVHVERQLFQDKAITVVE